MRIEKKHWKRKSILLIGFEQRYYDYNIEIDNYFKNYTSFKNNYFDNSNFFNNSLIGLYRNSFRLKNNWGMAYGISGIISDLTKNNKKYSKNLDPNITFEYSISRKFNENIYFLLGGSFSNNFYNKNNISHIITHPNIISDKNYNEVKLNFIFLNNGRKSSQEYSLLNKEFLLEKNILKPYSENTLGINKVVRKKLIRTDEIKMNNEDIKLDFNNKSNENISLYEYALKFAKEYDDTYYDLIKND